MPVIRVAFFLDYLEWQGGVNYFRNLFTAIKETPDININLVLVTGLKTDIDKFDDLVEIVRTPILDRHTFLWWASKLCAKNFPFRDYILYIFLRKHKIDLVSHNCVLWKNCKIPSIGWIPDFQHQHLPKFFDKKQCKAIDKQFLAIIQQSTAMILSSQDALNDLNKFYGDNGIPSYILRFVPSVREHVDKFPELSVLATKYNINQPWLYLPNQFWAHKNHSVVIEALNILKKQGNNFLVVATGSIEDSRNKRYFPSLMKKIKDYNLQDNFRILGMIPFPDVIALMQHSIAVINPSLFEGWSTPVEESKALGKVIILSNIPVHKEQAPDRGCFFDPSDYEQLAHLMKEVWKKYNLIEEKFYYDKAQSEYCLNRAKFAKQYEHICNSVIEEHRKINEFD